MIKSAGIYKFNNGRVIVHSFRSVKDSASYAFDPYFIIETPSNEVLAKKLIEALNESVYDAPEPIDWKALQKRHLKSMGMTSMNALHNGSTYISVFTKDGKYNLCPTINKGSRQGFQYTKHAIIIAEDSKIEELTIALMEAFEKCK